MSRYERNKGNRVEREIVNWHKDHGIPAERVPLSGASRYQGEGHDINVYPWGRSEPSLVIEVKARKNGAGSTLLRRWLGCHDALVCHEDREEDLVVVPKHIWLELLDAVRSTGTRRKRREKRDGAVSGRHEPSAARPQAKGGSTNVDLDESRKVS